MNIDTRNSLPDEGIAFEIPQLDAVPPGDRATASIACAADATEAAGSRDGLTASPNSVAAPGSDRAGSGLPSERLAERRGSIISAIRDSLDAAEARAAEAEARAREAEERLALHHRHCICRAGQVAEAIAAEDAAAEVVASDGSEAEAGANAAGTEPGSATGESSAMTEEASEGAPASVSPSGGTAIASRKAAGSVR